MFSNENASTVRNVPKCLNRRYKAMNELIRELSSNINKHRLNTNDPDEMAIKLMCDLWNILEEDPHINLPDALRQELGLEEKNSDCQTAFGAKDFMCYVINNTTSKKDCCKKESKRGPPSKCPSTGCDIPLSEVLCCLREASICDKNCETTMKGLMERQVELDEQIKKLEAKQEAGAKLLREADCMWVTMEEMYKEKLAVHTMKAKELADSLKEIGKSRDKWRKNKVELEAQMNEIKSFSHEVVEKFNKKAKDVVALETDLECLKKKTDVNELTITTIEETLGKRQAESDEVIKNIQVEAMVIERDIADVKSGREEKIHGPLKEDREEMQKIMNDLIKVQFELENIKEQKNTLLEEIEVNKKGCNNCQKRCDERKEFLEKESKRIDEEIEGFKLKCTKCGVGTDTSLFNKFCNDCSACAAMKDCLITDGKCGIDATKECVCTTTKLKFLDNVFENMYTILEKQSKTKSGKELGAAVLASLKKSKNGKVDDITKAEIKDFIMDSIKNNINMTIVGGAIKTRCEMSPEIHKQLMTCLKTVHVTKLEDAVKEDKATPARKDPCHRWKRYTECQCAKGPKECPCSEFDETKQAKKEAESNKVVLSCPHRGSKANQEAPKSSTLGGSASCPFTKDPKKKPQCVMTADITTRRNSPDYDSVDYTYDWLFRLGDNDEPKETVGNFIEDVVGDYTDETPLEKVSFTVLND